jgi:ABC-type lipoprotein release transport system permease subunit
MGTLFKLAWRNVWRNKRRTAITLASISFGLTALLLMQSLIKSIQDQLVEKATRAYSAHLQIQSEKTTAVLSLPNKRVTGVRRRAS